MTSKNAQLSTVGKTPVHTNNQSVIYHSLQDKTKDLANAYAKTDQLSHRYLAYRDLPKLIEYYVQGNRALDHGTGTGLSANYLHELGFNVLGVDINLMMLEKARETFPYIQFLETKNLVPKSQFDLVFSSFVLFDMKSKTEIADYLHNCSSFIDKSGIYIIITGSEELYSVSRNWTAFESNFNENINLVSGNVAKLILKKPRIEFLDYYWTENDYIDLFKQSNLKVLNIYKPLGNETDPYVWEDEKSFSPFTIYVLKKTITFGVLHNSIKAVCLPCSCLI